MIRLRFQKIDIKHQGTELGVNNAPFTNIARLMLAELNIPCAEDQDPVIAWIKAMHDENNLPYVPGLIDIRICQELESNPDVMVFFNFIGGELGDELDDNN